MRRKSLASNRGQTDPGVKFLARGHGLTLFLSSADAVLVTRGASIRMRLLGAHPDSDPQALDELPGRVHSFIDRDPRGWRTDAPTYVDVDFSEGPGHGFGRFSTIAPLPGYPRLRTVLGLLDARSDSTREHFIPENAISVANAGKTPPSVARQGASALQNGHTVQRGAAPCISVDANL